MANKVTTILTIVCIGILSGCATNNQKGQITTKTIAQSVPVLYCPAPLNIPRPDLPITILSATDLQNDGEVVKSYVATVTALEGYIIQLEDQLQQYKNDNQAYADLASKLDNEWFTKTGTHLDLPDPTKPVIVPKSTK